MTADTAPAPPPSAAEPAPADRFVANPDGVARGEAPIWATDRPGAVPDPADVEKVACPECSGSLMARCGLPCDVCEGTGTAEGHARLRAALGTGDREGADRG